MSENIKQLFDANPAAAMTATDLFYLGRSPFAATNDMAITWANTLSSIASQASGTWGISISGTAANATNVVTTQVSNNASYFPLMSPSSTNGNHPADLATGLTYNPSTNTLTTTTFVGALTGNATSATTATTATTATNATNVATTQLSTNASFFPLFVASSTNGNQAASLGTGLTYNPSTNTLTTTTFVGALTGNATTSTSTTTATNATNVGTTQVSNNASYFPLMVASSTNGNQACDLGTGLTFNPSTNTLSTTTFSGALSGNATTATTATSATTATTATNATNVATTQVSNSASYFPLMVASSTNGNQACDLGTGLTFNPSTNTLTTTTFAGNLTGNAATVTGFTSPSVQTGGSTNNSSSGSGAYVDHTPTYTLPANSLVTGKAIRVTAMIRFTSGGTPPNMAIALKVGSTQVYAPLALRAPTNDRTNWSYKMEWIVAGSAAAGSSANTYTSEQDILVSNTSTNSMNTVVQPVALATNGTLAITIQSQWSGAGVGTNTITLDALIVEYIG